MDNNEQFDIEEDLLPGEEEETCPPEAQQEPSAPAPEEDVPQLDERPAPPKKNKTMVSWQKNLLLYIHDIVYLAAILVVVSLLCLRVVVVSGTSMYNTLLDGDYLFVLSNAFYTEPRVGDIVVVSKESFDDGSPIVKRVIATEGQTVDIDFDLGIVYVDGTALDEPYTYTATNTYEGVNFPLTVQEGYIFCLGDNRNVSRDSRYPAIGQIAVEEVLGKVVFLFMPGTNGTDALGNPNEPRDWSRIGVIG